MATEKIEKPNLSGDDYDTKVGDSFGVSGSRLAVEEGSGGSEQGKKVLKRIDRW